MDTFHIPNHSAQECLKIFEHQIQKNLVQIPILRIHFFMVHLLSNCWGQGAEPCSTMAVLWQRTFPEKWTGRRGWGGEQMNRRKTKTGRGCHLLLIKWLKLLQMKLVNSTFNSGKVMNENMGECFPWATEDIDDTKKEAAQHLISRQKGVYGLCPLTNNSEFLETIMFLFTPLRISCWDQWLPLHLYIHKYLGASKQPYN